MKRINIGPDAILRALRNHGGCRSKAARECNMRIDPFRAAIKRCEAQGFVFPKAPSTVNLTDDEVYMPTPRQLRIAMLRIRLSWSDSERYRRWEAARTLSANLAADAPDPYEIPTGMSFRTLDGRSR